MELDTQLAGDITAELASGSDPTDAQFRVLVESVSDYAIYLLDSAGRVMSWNTGAERIKGYAAAGGIEEIDRVVADALDQHPDLRIGRGAAARELRSDVACELRIEFH